LVFHKVNQSIQTSKAAELENTPKKKRPSRRGESCWTHSSDKQRKHNGPKLEEGKHAMNLPENGKAT
jgi:hypothetical protein